MTTQSNTSFTAKAATIAFAAFATFVVLTSAMPNAAEAGPRYPFGLGSLSGMDLGSGR
jgi:hypothetical protein